MQNTEKERDAYAYALRALARKGHTKKELIKKMTLKGFSEEAIGYALLKVAPYLNDEELLKRIVEELIQRGKGPLAIIYKITQTKGESKEEIARLVAELYSEEEQLRVAKTLAEKKQDKGKAYRFILSRGFSHAIAFAALRN